MKKLFLLLACATVLFACDKDDDKGKTPEKPQNSLFSEPILTFGASRATIKQQEKRTLLEDIPDGLAYMDKTYLVAYMFEDDKLITSVVVLPLSTDMNTLKKILSSNYDYVGTYEEYTYWEATGRGLVVGLYVEPDAGIAVMYAPRSAFNSPEDASSIQRSPFAENTGVTDVKNAIRQLMK